MKTNNEFPVKRYPFQFSGLMIFLFLLALLLSFVGFGLTLWRFLDFIKDDASSVYGWIQYLILFFVSILLAVIVIAILIRSEYVINDKELILSFGIIRTKYLIKDICSIHLFKGANKLTVYFDDFKTKYTVIVVKESWYDDFIKTLSERKPSIGFSFSTAEEEDELKKK